MPSFCRFSPCTSVVTGLLIFCAVPIASLMAEDADVATRDAWRRIAEHAKGYVVWESNRSGRWRIWHRNLDGSDYRQLSPEEKDRDHYAPHISPDGEKLIYLSCPTGQDPNKGGHPLHLMRRDGSNDRVLIPLARSYGGDRAAVWYDNQHFAYIDSAGVTQEFDLESGKSLRLTADGQKDNGGLLINVAKTYATIGYPPTFSPFDPASARITPQAALGGCEPYFTHDGHWGYWMGGAGGPINRIELSTRKISPIINKDDSRMPKERAYLYFPMVSRNGRLFTFAASPHQHDHDKSDYDVFVSLIDPKSLEMIDRPVRYSFDSATDRYPDVFSQAASVAAVATNERPATTPAPNSSPNQVNWPTRRDGLAYLFQTADTPNEVQGTDGKRRSFSMTPRGRARWDHNQALVLTRGSFLVENVEQDLLTACRQSNQLTVEAVIKPDHLDQTGPARIVTFSSSAHSRNFTLAQMGDKLVFRLRTPSTGENGVNPETTLGTIVANQPTHVAVTYQPGQLVAYVNGREVHRSGAVQGNFSNWAPHRLVFGDELDYSRNWAGTLEGVAIYQRALEPAEIQQNSAEYLRLLKARKSVPQIEMAAKLLAKSPAPTLDEVKPYRGALMVNKYEVIQVVRGTLSEKQILVTQWALLDGQAQSVAGLSPGADVRLVLEAAESNPQLQRFVCKDRFDADDELLLPRYYDVTP